MQFVNFNQDCSSLIVGTKNGYRLYAINAVDKLENIYTSDSDDVCLVDRLFSSSLVAVVSLSSPRKLKVCHFKKGTEICNYSYSNTILNVKLNRLRLIVCLEESLYIHNIRDMKVLHTIRDTPPNPTGICALSSNNDNCYLAYPGSHQTGGIEIFDTVNLRAVATIQAHDSRIASISFNLAGSRLATASEKGTVLRVFSVPEAQKLYEFRRGVKRCATIHSLAFSLDSAFLTCSSNTETIHIFRLDPPLSSPKDKIADDAPQGWMGYFNQALKSSANYLPSQVTEMLNQGRDFAFARLPSSGVINVCAIASVQKMPRLLVASHDGFLYIYTFDPVEGGECSLLKQHRIDGQPETVSPSCTTPTAAEGPSGLLQSPSPASRAQSTPTRTVDIVPPSGHSSSSDSCERGVVTATACSSSPSRGLNALHLPSADSK